MSLLDVRAVIRDEILAAVRLASRLDAPSGMHDLLAMAWGAISSATHEDDLGDGFAIARDALAAFHVWCRVRAPERRPSVV